MWKANDEGSSLTDHRFEVDAARMFVHDDRARDGESLTGALAYLFGGEERIEYPAPDVEGDSLSCVPDANLDPGGTPCGFHLNLALGSVCFFRTVADGVSCVHDQIENHLVELSR